MADILALDIGGANTKACLADFSPDAAACDLRSLSLAHAVYRDPQGLVPVLQRIYQELAGAKRQPQALALTMTAELCDVFASREAGVLFLLDLVERSLPQLPCYVWTVEGRFAAPAELRRRPGLAAAANWLASASALACSPGLAGRAALFGDCGSTTTDLLLLAEGQVQTSAQTDLERLQSGELLYSGVLRTSLDALLDQAAVAGQHCQIAREYFACTADAYCYLGRLTPEQYQQASPDGGSKDRPGCARRLARVVAADTADLTAQNLRTLALQVEAKQRQQIIDSLLHLLSGKNVWPELLITAGQGSFLLEQAAHCLGWPTQPWWQLLPGAGPEAAATTCALAWLLQQSGKVAYDV